MEYLLTKVEYDDLVNKDTRLADQVLRSLQEVCTYAANEVPIKYWGREEASPWGCIISTEDEWYCDECPAQHQCPYEDKQWSK